MAQYVKLGPKANFFRCSSLDMSIAPGEVVGLNAKQMNHSMIRRALNGGHLVIVEKEQKEAPKELSAEDLRDSLLEMRAAGDSEKKILKSFSLDELIKISALYEIEVEEGDKKADVYAAIVSAIEE